MPSLTSSKDIFPASKYLKPFDKAVKNLMPMSPSSSNTGPNRGKNFAVFCLLDRQPSGRLPGGSLLTVLLPLAGTIGPLAFLNTERFIGSLTDYSRAQNCFNVAKTCIVLL